MAITTKKTTKKVVAQPASRDELLAAILVAQTDLVEARRSLAAGELANTTRLRELRKLIAQYKTTLRHNGDDEEKK